jgi:hypothetical protein
MYYPIAGTSNYRDVSTLLSQSDKLIAKGQFPIGKIVRSTLCYSARSD